MADFNVAFLKTNAHEGGWVDDPDDSGGETLNGISRKFWPDWPGWAIVDRIKTQVGRDAKKIDAAVKKDAQLQDLIWKFYKTNFWDVNALDQVKYQDIANEMYDTAVNMGVGVAAEFLQHALNLCNKNQVSYPDVKTDGKISPNGETIRTLNNHAHPVAILNTLNMQQGARYIDIMRRNRKQEKFWEGWMKRVIVSGRW